MGIKKFDKKDKVIALLLLTIILVLVLTLSYSGAANPCEACKFEVDKYDIGKTNCIDFATKIIEDCNCICDGDINQPFLIKKQGVEV